MRYNFLIALASFAPVGFHDKVDVTLKGLYGAVLYNEGFSRSPLRLTEDSIVFCYSCQTSEGVDYNALVCGDLSVTGSAELICETEHKGAAIDTLPDVPFSSSDYDLMVIKMTGPTSPLPPLFGINVNGGVHESNCRYIKIKPRQNASDGLLGDVNGDGSVNMKDILLLRRSIAGLVELTPEQANRADANIDKSVNMKDVLLIRQVIAGLVTL